MTAAPIAPTSPFLEEAPPELNARLAEVLPAGEEPLLRLASDMADDAAYGERWLVLTRKRLLLVGVDGTDEAAIDAIRDARVEALVGGGFLQVNRKEGPPLLLHYSGSHAPKFAEACEAVNQLARDRWVQLMWKAFEEADLPADAAAVMKTFLAQVATFLINQER